MQGKDSGRSAPRLLVVDDDAAIAALIEGLLDDVFSVRVAERPLDALALAEAEMPDVAVLDVMMQGMTGITLAERLRALPGGDRLAIFLMSAHHGLRPEFSRAPIDGYFLKPFDPDEIVATLTAAAP